MTQDKEKVLASLLTNAASSAELFAQLMNVPVDAVPATVRTHALLRRVMICFISLYEYLCQKVDLPEDKNSLEDIVDYFVSKNVIMSQDKDLFISLGSAYGAIRWAKPGNMPDEEKIIEQAPDLLALMQRIIVMHTPKVTTSSQHEATL